MGTAIAHDVGVRDGVCRLCEAGSRLTRVYKVPAPRHSTWDGIRHIHAEGIPRPDITESQYGER